MVNRRHIVLSRRCWYDHRLGVLGVAKITMSVSVCACCVCVAYLSVQLCLCECVFLVTSAYNYNTHFFAFLYPRSLPPGHITKPFWHPTIM